MIKQNDNVVITELSSGLCRANDTVEHGQYFRVAKAEVVRYAVVRIEYKDGRRQARTRYRVFDKTGRYSTKGKASFLKHYTVTPEESK